MTCAPTYHVLFYKRSVGLNSSTCSLKALVNLNNQIENEAHAKRRERHTLLHLLFKKFTRFSERKEIKQTL